MRHVVVVPAAALVLLASSLVFSESLGEVAAREKEKKKADKPTKVITESDLGKRGSGHGTFSSSDGAPAPAATEAPKDGAAPAAPAAPKDPNAPAAPKEKTPEELRADQETAWRARRDAKVTDIARIEANIARFEARRTTYADPVAQADLEKARTELAAAKSELQGLEDERRRAGFKP